MISLLDELRNSCPSWALVKPITQEFVYEMLARDFPTAYWSKELDEPIELQPRDVELEEWIVLKNIKNEAQAEAESRQYADVDTLATWTELLMVLRKHPGMRARFSQITGTLKHCARYQFGLVNLVRIDQVRLLNPIYLRPIDCLWTLSWDRTSGPCWESPDE